MIKNIKINNKNIRRGEKANPQNCAIAKAIKEQMKQKISNVSVLPSRIVLSIKNKNYFAQMPNEGKNFIKRFDRGLAVNPFVLKLKFKKGYVLI